MQSIRSFLISVQFDHLVISKLNVCPWKFTVMAYVKPNGHISGLEFNWYVYFSLRGDFWLRYSKFRVIHGEGHENRPKSNRVIYRSGPSILPK